MMIPYSPLHPAADKELLKVAKVKGVGVVVMKPFGCGGGFLNSVWAVEVKHSETDQFYQSAKPYQASLRWVLQNRNIDGTVPGAHSVQEIDELFKAAQEKYSQKRRYLCMPHYEVHCNTETGHLIVIIHRFAIYFYIKSKVYK